MSATISLMGLYEFDDHLFDGFNYPAEFTQEERGTLIDNLMLDTAELELLYPDAHFMAIAIRAWTKKELPVWEKLLATTKLEYNPIWNKDGSITETITGKHQTDGSGETTRKDSYTDTGSGESTGTVNNGTNHKVSGYNLGSGTATDWEQSDNGSSSENQSSTLQHKAEGSDTHTSTETGSTEQTLTRTEQGNIGVTTTQAMIKEERDVDKFNIMDYIIDSFKKRFCLLVY